jgi:hypothetical protein
MDTLYTTSLTFTILRSAHTVYLCVLYVSQSKQRLFPYTALPDWFLRPRRSAFTVRYGLDLYIPPGLTVSNSTLCPHSLCVLCGSENKQRLFPYTNINWVVFITETDCAVRTGYLYTASLTFSNSTFCPHSLFMCFMWF